MRDCIRRVYLSLWPGALTGLESAVCLERDTLRSRHLTFVFLSKSDNNARFFFGFKITSFTLEQKVNITTGVGLAGGRCVGNTPPVDDFPGLCLEDSPLGVRAADFVTGFPAGINAAAT